MIISLEHGANDLHMVQLMPLPPDHFLGYVQTGSNNFQCFATQ